MWKIIREDVVDPQVSVEGPVVNQEAGDEGDPWETPQSFRPEKTHVDQDKQWECREASGEQWI